jgi:hypothetical protein
MRTIYHRLGGLRRSGSGFVVSNSTDAPDSPPASASPAWLAARREQRREAAAKRRRRRLFLVLIGTPLLGLLAWAVTSYTIWMLKPTSMSLSARSVEWVRAEAPFGNTIVDDIEHIYYTANAPKKGGPAPKRLPAVGLRQPRSKRTAAWPPPIKSVFAHPLPEEGIWRPAVRPVDGGPPVLVTTFRPEAEYPELIAYVAWFDHTRSAIAYYPGRYEPPSAAVRGPSMVPYGQRWRLIAAFNGGFTHEDGETARPSTAGSTSRSRTAKPRWSAIATVASRSSSGTAARTRDRTSRGRARALRRSSGTGARTPR